MSTETAAVCAEIHALGEQCQQALEAMITRLERKMLRRAIWAALAAFEREAMAVHEREVTKDRVVHRGL